MKWNPIPSRHFRFPLLKTGQCFSTLFVSFKAPTKYEILRAAYFFFTINNSIDHRLLQIERLGANDEPVVGSPHGVRLSFSCEIYLITDAHD